MERCEVCGNNYDDPIEIKKNGKSHWYDCFECAIYSLAPKCEHCGVKILGHGIQMTKKMFCCAHCARAEGYDGAVDHVSAI